MATNGAISKSTAETLSLNDKEMKDVVGGYFNPQYAYYMSSARTSVVMFGYLSETLPGNSNPVYVVAERYGATLSSGYNVYLTYGNPQSLAEAGKTKNTMYGTTVNATPIPMNLNVSRALGNNMSQITGILARIR